jgi:G3E family GTPase
MTDSAANTVPVTIITGFLGSGKTTLLNRLLQQPSLADTVVIVNEFGAVGLDHLLIEQAIEDAVLLKNGCICCTVRGDIADTLELLWQRRESGALPPFRRIAIETTGLADPAPVAHALLSDDAARYACRLDGIVTTVDALHGAAQLDRQPEARRQVAMADRILLTKTDLASAADIAVVAARIAALNAGAPMRHVVHGDGAVAADVFGLGPDDAADDARIAAWLQAFEADPHRGHHHLPFRHGDAIGSVVLRTDRPVAWPALRLWLESVLSLHGDDVLRLKGLVRLAGQQRLVVLQGVHHVLHPPVLLGHEPADAGNTRIVLITRGLPPAGLRASFVAAMRRP